MTTRALPLVVFSLFFVLVLAAVFSSSSAAAAPAEVRDAASFYLRSGEVITVIQTISADGGPYYLVIISNVPAVVLHSANGTYESVTDSTALASVIRAYLRGTFNATPFTPAFVHGVQGNASLVEATVGDCVAGIHLIEKNAGSKTYIYLRNGRSTYFPKEWGAYCHILPDNNVCGMDIARCANLSASASAGQVAACGDYHFNIPGVSSQNLTSELGGLNTSVNALAAGVSSQDVDAIGSALTALGTNATALKTDYATASSNANLLTSTFLYLMSEGSVEHNCSQGANYTAAINYLAALRGQNQYYAVDALTQTLQEQTMARQSFAHAAETYGGLKSKLDAAVDQQVAATAEYANIGVNLPCLADASNTAKAKLDGVKNATDATFNASLASFNNAFNSLQQTVSAYDATFSAYNASLAASQQTDLALSHGKDRLGANDDRLTALQANQTEVKKELDAKTQILLSCNPPAAADFNALTAQFSAIQAQTVALQPKENQIDFVLVGGAVVVIALLGAVIYVVRKRKKDGGQGSQPLALGPQN